MASFTITLNGIACEANEGESVLDVAQRAGVFIPHLCYLEGADHPLSACRLCFVAVKGLANPVCACEVVVSPGMEVSTADEGAIGLSRAALSMALAEHRVSCKDCAKKGACLVVESAKALGVPLRTADPLDEDPDRQDRIDSLPAGAVAVDHGKCVLCGKCVAICKTTGKSFIGFTGRGLNSLIAVDAQADAETCTACARCVEACPAGALSV